MERLNKKARISDRNLDKTRKKAEYHAKKVDPDLLAWCDALNITLDEYYTMSEREMMLRTKNLEGILRLRVASNLIAVQKEKLNLNNKIHFTIEKKDRSTDTPKFFRQSAGEEKFNNSIRNGKPQSSKHSVKVHENQLPGSSNVPVEKIEVLRQHKTLSNPSLRSLLPSWLQKSSNKPKGQIPSKENVHTLLPKMLRKVRQDDRNFKKGEVNDSKRNKSRMKKLLCKTATDLERLYGGGNDNCGNVFLEAMDSKDFDYDECSEEDSEDENGSWIGGWRRSFIELVDPPVPHDTSFDNDPNPPPISSSFNPAPQLCSTPKLGPRGRRPMLRNFSDYEFHLTGLGDYSSIDDVEQSISFAENGLGADVVHVKSKSRIIAPRHTNTNSNVGKSARNTSRRNATFIATENATVGRGNGATFKADRNNGLGKVGKEYTAFKPGRNSTRYLDKTFNTEARPNATYAVEKESYKARRNKACPVRKDLTYNQNEMRNSSGLVNSTYTLNASQSDTALNVSEFRNTSFDLPQANSTMRNSRSQRNSCCTSPGRSINISTSSGKRPCSRPQESGGATFNLNDRSSCKGGSGAKEASIKLFTVNKNVNQIIIKLV